LNLRVKAGKEEGGGSCEQQSPNGTFQDVEAAKLVEKKEGGLFHTSEESNAEEASGEKKTTHLLVKGNEAQGATNIINRGWGTHYRGY